MIRELQEDHEVIITCRPLANTIELLQLHGLNYTVIGKHYGASLQRKIYGYPIRVLELFRFLKKCNPDMAISQSSFHSPLTAWLLGIKSIYMNDNEHALGNVPAFLFADKIMIPEFLDIQKIIGQGARQSKIVQYPGIKEGIYLWDMHVTQKETKKIYIRPEPRTAQYYKGKTNFLDALVLDLMKKSDIVLLPRDSEQKQYFKKKEFKNIYIPDKPLNLNDIVMDCALFIGAGGTMTRELAFLGIPTISIYQDDLLDVDKYLIKHGYMIHQKDLDAETALDYMRTYRKKNHKTNLRDKGKDAYNLIKEQIVNIYASGL